MSTGAMLCRSEHSLIDRSMPTGVLCSWRFGGRSTVLSQSDRSIVLAIGALLCRQEHGLSSCALFCGQEHGFGGRGTVLSHSDRSIALAAGPSFCLQEHGFVRKSNAMSTGA